MTKNSVKPLCFLAAVLTLFLTTPLLAASAATPVAVGEKVGDSAPLTELSTILADPDAWKGKEVRVRGTVTGVCAKKGCWMELTEEGSQLRLKVEDDVLVFPADAEGRLAEARGTVSVQEMSRESYLAWHKHLAEDRGETFDESTLGDGPYRMVQLDCLGAEVGK